MTAKEIAVEIQTNMLEAGSNFDKTKAAVEAMIVDFVSTNKATLAKIKDEKELAEVLGELVDMYWSAGVLEPIDNFVATKGAGILIHLINQCLGAGTVGKLLADVQKIDISKELGK